MYWTKRRSCIRLGQWHDGASARCMHDGGREQRRAAIRFSLGPTSMITLSIRNCAETLPKCQGSIDAYRTKLQVAAMRVQSFCRVLVVWLASLSLIEARRPSHDSCKNPIVRNEWGSLSKHQRRAYIDAVLCLQNKPSQLPHGLVPGARNRHDDFVATHINLTASIHLDGIFLTWHRNFVWLWETALRTECGYTGHQPYWNWPLWQSKSKLSQSPLFDGSDTSLGGDGFPSDSYNCTPIGVWPNGTNICMPRAHGGGCMMRGPFVNSKANLGPFEFSQAFTGLPADWTKYNPRCLSRDLNDEEARFLSYEWYDHALRAPTINDFQNRLSNVSSDNGGLHAVGHYVVGHAMWDFFASPYDPAFFLHHGGVDRIWTRWQAIDPTQRVYGHNALFGTSTILNGNSTPPVTFDTVLNWGYLGREKTLRELMSPTECGFCYTYEI